MTGPSVLHVPGYSALQNAYTREGTREEIQAALAALGNPRPIVWRVPQGDPARVDVPLSAVPPKFMARTLADAIESLRALYDYKANGDGRKVGSEIRRGEAWLADRGWSYGDSRQLRCTTCRRTYSRVSKAEDDQCSRLPDRRRVVAKPLSKPQ
jgi:hypothetical protein